MLINVKLLLEVKTWIHSQEFLKSTVDLADFAGLYLVLTSIPGKGHSKVLTAGIGWATAEVILSRALFLWVGARGAEFDWIYIQKCLESNILLVSLVIFLNNLNNSHFFVDSAYCYCNFGVALV